MTADRIADALGLLVRAVETHDGAPADTNLARAQVLATIAVAEQLAELTQAITRVYPPAPAPGTGGQAEQPAAPRVMVNDRWKDGDGEIWWGATNAFGEPGLTLGDHLCTWGEVDGAYGPLTLIERAGYRRTTDTVTAGQLRPGMVVSHPDWWGDTPVELLTGTSAEFTYRMLGEDEDGPDTVIAAPCATLTVWAGQAVTA